MIFLSKKKILVINGPNLNLLGKREPTIYGSSSLEDINEVMLQKAAVNNIDIEFLQSNHEGVIVDSIQDATNKFDYISIWTLCRQGAN